MGNEEERRDDGSTLAVRMVRDAVPTSRHAEMLFRMVEDLLGDDAYVESANGGTNLVLFRRARSGENDYVPWPLVSLCIGGRLSQVIMLSDAEGEPPPSAARKRRPRLRHAGPGEVIVHDGPESITVSYGEDGHWFETARSADPRTLAGVVPFLNRGSAQPVELLADFAAGLDLERHGPGSVHMPVHLPGALRSVWLRGVRAIRHGLYHDRLPVHACWVAADGYDGIALAWGDTRTEALERWRKDVERLRPTPPKPTQQPPTDPPPDAIRMAAPRADGVVHEPAPENTPAVVVRLDAQATAAPAFGRWTRLLGHYGTTRPAAMRRDTAGFTLVGDKLLDTLGEEELARLDETLAEAPPPADFRSIPGLEDRPARNCCTVFYRLVDETTGRAIAPLLETLQSDEFDPQLLDGDRLRWDIVRQRWRDLE